MTTKNAYAIWQRLILTTAIATVITPWPVPAAATGEAISPVIKINEAAGKADIKVDHLRGGISVLSGSGGNITVLAGNEGKLMVDAGIAVSQPKISSALNTISPAPLKYLINTHWHWDHTDGNRWIHAAGATIIAHENTLKHMSETTRVEEWDYTFKPWPVPARPTVLVKGTKTIQFAGTNVILKHFGRGHTDGDIWVYFQKADVLVLGDTFWNGYYPFIDDSTGGGINESILWANKAVEQSTEKTIIVPGHGPVGTRAQLIEFRDMLVTVRDNVSALKKQGKSLEEVIAAKPTIDFDAKFGGYVIDPTFFTKLVYVGV